MKTHLALLRGINVGGQKIIKMEELRNILSSNGFRNVETYIQTGNIFFEIDNDGVNISSKIKELISEKYGFEVEVILVNKEELEWIVENNPFLNESADTKQLYVFYLNQKVKSENIKELLQINFGNDQFKIIDKYVFVKYELGAGKTKLDNKIIEKKLQVFSTARNWNTTLKLLQLFRKRD